ncbi:hypothetical protein Bhyg_00087, partial [Pseudolycoriella hygida]
EILNDANEEKRLFYFKKFLPITIILTLIVVLIMVVNNWFNAKKIKNNQAASDILVRTAKLAENKELYKKSLGHLIATSDNKIKELAEIEQVSVEIKQNNFQQADLLLQNIINNKDYDDITTSYARLIWLSLNIDKADLSNINTKKMEEYLNYFDNSSKPFYGVGRLIKAHWYIRNGAKDLADETLKHIIMIKQLLITIPFLFFLVSCGNGFQKTKNITELTTKLVVENNEIITVDSNIGTFTPKMFKAKEYGISKHKIIAEPIIYNDTIYAIDKKGNVNAFSITSKSIIWTYNISVNKNDHYVGGGILYHNGKLYITYGSRFLVVLDSISGHEIIRKELSDIVRISPVLIDNHNIVHEGIAEILLSSYHVAPIVRNGHIIVNYSSEQIAALNFKGEVVWVQDIPSNQSEIGLPNFETSSILCKPIIDNSYLYIASSNGKLIKINIDNGHILWQVKAEDIQSMSLSGNSLFITNNAGQIAAISTDLGRVKFVGNLISSTKKPRASMFLAPIVGKLDNNWNLNIISNKGELYSFQSGVDSNLGQYPQTTKIPKNIGYYGNTVEGNMYFITENKVIFVNP